MTANDIRTPKDRSIKIKARLKKETRESHAKLESLQYFKALIVKCQDIDVVAFIN